MTCLLLEVVYIALKNSSLWFSLSGFDVVISG